MGEIRVKVVLQNKADAFLRKRRRSVTLDALVDTEAVMILLPQDVVEELGLRKMGSTIVTLANEEKVELEVAEDLTLTIAGRTWTTDCLIGPPQCEPLIGQLVMERLDLILDPLKKTLTPRPESPYLPSLKLK